MKLCAMGWILKSSRAVAATDEFVTIQKEQAWLSNRSHGSSLHQLSCVDGHFILRKYKHEMKLQL